MGENNFAKWPVVLYGVVLLMAGFAYYLLAHCLTAIHGKDLTLAIAIGNDRKGILSLIIYAIGIALSFINPWLGFATYIVVAGMWLIPDRRIEKKLGTDNNK